MTNVLLIATPGSADTDAAIINAILPLTLLPSGDVTGVTDRNAINAAFALMSASTTGANHVLWLASGEYYVDQKCVYTFPTPTINIPMLMFIGIGGVHIIQVTNNTGIWEFQCPVNCSPRGLLISGIKFDYSSQQPAANTAAVCLGFRAVSATATNETIYEIQVVQCEFRQGYRGIANTQPAGVFTTWGITFNNNQYTNLSGAAVRLVSPVSSGQPNIEISNSLVAGPYIGGSEPIFSIDACDTLGIKNNEVLSVSGQSAYNISSSPNFKIDQCKVESYTASGTVPVLNITDSSGTILGMHFVGTVNGGRLLTAFCAAANTGLPITINHIDVGATDGTGTFTLFNSNQNINLISPPCVTAFGTGPAVFRLTDSGSTASANFVNLLSYPGGEISDDIGDASITWKGFDPANLPPSVNARVNVWNTPLTAGRSVTLPTGTGNVAADNLWNGAECEVVRTANATGASSLTVTGSIPASKTYAAGTSGKWKWRRSLGWVEVENGTL